MLIYDCRSDKEPRFTLFIRSSPHIPILKDLGLSAGYLVIDRIQLNGAARFAWHLYRRELPNEQLGSSLVGNESRTRYREAAAD
jgi:hypothetical protein